MNTTNALSRVQAAGMPAPEMWRTMSEMAKALYESGMLPKHIQSPQAALAVIQKGSELGVPPMHALSNIVVIGGKPTCNSELMLALIYRDHGDDAFRWGEASETVAECFYRRHNASKVSAYMFTMDDAKRAGLLDGPNSGNWKKYPGAMLRARCISAVARMAFPDTIGGMYTPDELGAAVVVDADGSVNYDARETLQPSPEPPHAIADATVVDGRIVTDDGEIVGQLEQNRPSPELLAAEFQRRLKGADNNDALKEVWAWCQRTGADNDEAFEAVKERRRELRAAAKSATEVEQPELVGVE